jgi:hypothetical protein
VASPSAASDSARVVPRPTRSTGIGSGGGLISARARHGTVATGCGFTWTVTVDGGSRGRSPKTRVWLETSRET